MNNEAFCFDPISAVSELPQKTPLFKAASDGIQLAYYPFVHSWTPKAVVAFYHGGGAWSCTLYQAMAQRLCEDYGIAVYLIDVRGHGKSQGKRGDAPNKEQVFEDMATMLGLIKYYHPQTPLFLGGHSSGAGLILNFPLRDELVSGSLLLAPYLGSNSKTIQPTQSFVHKVNKMALFMHGISSGRWYAHEPAVFFNYPPWLKQQDPYFLSSHTCAMASAVELLDAPATFKAIKKPYAVFIGAQEEQMIPDAVINYAKLSPEPAVMAEIIPETTHLSIITKAPQLLIQAIDQILKKRELDS